MIAPGHFPILDTRIRWPWKCIKGSLTFEGVGEPKPVPQGHIRIDSGFGYPLDVPKGDLVPGYGWAYQ
jgi:hypothetical protein